MRVDIWLDPSWERKTNIILLTGTNARYHSNSLMLRAIENGVNLIKPTYDGDSLALDYYGNILTSSANISNNICVGDIPMTGVTTFYNVFSTYINWSYIICLVLVCVLTRKEMEK